MSDLELSEKLYTRVKEWAVIFSDTHEVDVQVRRSGSVAIIRMGMAVVHTSHIKLEAAEFEQYLMHCDNVFTLNILLIHSLRARNNNPPGDDSGGVTTDNWKDVSVALAELDPNHKPCSHDWEPITPHRDYWHVLSRESKQWRACDECYALHRIQERTL